MIDTFEHSYAFRPDVRIVVHDANKVEIRTGVWSCSSVTFSDDEQGGALAKVVLGLLHGQPMQAIAQDAGISTDDIVGVVEVLASNDLLVLKESADQWMRMAYLVTPTLGSGKEVREIPQQVVLLGPTFMTDLFRSVIGTPVTNKLQIVDENQLASLAGGDLFLEADGFASVDAAAPFAPWQGALVVVVWPELNPILLGNLNSLAYRVGFKFLPAVTDGPFAIVGPTVVPGSTPCFACAEVRVLDSLRDHTLYTEYRSALARGQVYGTPVRAPDPFQAMILSLAAWEAVNFLTVGSAFTSGKLLTLYAPTMEITFHELLRLPGCPVCGTCSGLDQPLYTDLRSYLSTQLGWRRDC